MEKTDPEVDWCWHRNGQGEFDCKNERRHECFNCKVLVCEQHTTFQKIHGVERAHCNECYAALFAKNA